MQVHNNAGSSVKAAQIQIKNEDLSLLFVEGCSQ